MKAIWHTLLLSIFISGSLSAGNLDNFFSKANDFFGQHVNRGLVDYAAIKEDGQQLKALLEDIAQTKTDQLSENELKAFYINSYNLFVIKNILQYYPISSPLDEAGFFDSNTFIMAGKKITLNELENKIIRPTYKDARFHFVLVCGALGCPPIISQAYTAGNVEELLNRQTTAALNNADFTRVKKGSLELSEILKWYRDDFGKSDADIIAYINQFRKTKIAKDSKLSYYTYNWKTNEKK